MRKLTDDQIRSIFLSTLSAAEPIGFLRPRVKGWQLLLAAVALELWSRSPGYLKGLPNRAEDIVLCKLMLDQIVQGKDGQKMLAGVQIKESLGSHLRMTLGLHTRRCADLAGTFNRTAYMREFMRRRRTGQRRRDGTMPPINWREVQ